MRVLGIDPGGWATGYGLVEAKGARLRYVASGAIRPRGGLAARLHWIHQGLMELVAKYSPEEVAVEEVFAARNFRSALALGEARGAALVAASAAGLEVFEYSAAEVKKAVVGYGRADKRQVQAMVRRLLGLPPARPLAEDAADALAVAICHLNSRRLSALTAASR